ncbi:cobalt ABC transporter, permease protein CbiQ [Halolamina pelagica]|uniref:Cobalt ABC transporter, permease protein CbiQ n=1 Tax=Halolamina pelagica TaxID=699431 RepID=A0A0N8HZI3_9EURY|nr:energy-coupling factor transporter transmembrane component T [Halolamina pelagica]KPN29587.1 cobalt ABC transporter, permease protein CbiQ [Halolamina pelagica]
MLGYEPGDSLAHRLDPRTKLAVQLAFAAAAFAHTDPRGLAMLTGVTALALASARLSPVSVIWGYRFLLPLLAAAVLFELVTLGPPWIELEAAADPLLASYRTLLIVAVAAGYVRTTPARESRAAVQWAVPGKPGRLLGAGVGLVFRFLPLLRRDLAAIRDAERARLGDERSTRERLETVGAAGLRRAFARADRLAMALSARCFSWNATLPRIRFRAVDVPAVLLAAGLGASMVV